MLLTSIGEAAQGVAGAIRKAASATGAGFDYLLRTASRESNLDPSARAPNSSAAGIFQFVEQTWLEVLKEEGGRFGLDAEAAQITRQRSGRYTVADPEVRSQILSMRHDPEISALLAGALTERNSTALQSRLGRTPDAGELYAAHFLGANGAGKLISLAERNPEVRAAAYFPEAASANASIFYDKGQARSAAEVLANLKAKHQGVIAPAHSRHAASMVLAAHEAAQDALPVVAEGGPVFHSMYKTGRRQPVNAYVEQVWRGVRDATPAANNASSDARAVAATPSVPMPEPRPARSVASVGAPLDLSSFLKVAQTPPSSGTVKTS